MGAVDRLQERIDRAIAGLERCRDAAPLLWAMAEEWSPGYSSAGVRGNGTSDPTYKAAEAAVNGQADPSAEIQAWLAELERTVTAVTRRGSRHVGPGLDRRRALLLPLPDDVALKLVDGDTPVCRAHQRISETVPVIRRDGGRDELCRWCYGFRCDYHVDPPASVLKRRSMVGRVTVQFIEQALKPKPASRRKRKR